MAEQFERARDILSFDDEGTVKPAPLAYDDDWGIRVAVDATQQAEEWSLTLEGGYHLDVAIQDVFKQAFFRTVEQMVESGGCWQVQWNGAKKLPDQRDRRVRYRATGMIRRV